MKKLIIFFVFLFTMLVVAGQPSITIGILDGKPTAESQPLLNKLKQEIISLLGQDVSFSDVLYNNNDIRIAKANYNNLLIGETDIIIAFGIVNTIVIYEEASYPKPVIIVGAINNDLVNIPKNQLTSGINNLTYLITPFSYKDDLDAFSSILPYKKVGIILDDFMLDLLPLKGLFDKYFEDKEATYIFIPATTEIYTDSLLSNLDAVYLVSYNNLSSNELAELIIEINNRKLPSLSGYGVKDVEKGVLATNQPAINFDQIFRRIALNVESISNNINASELPLYIDYEKKMTINMATAEQIGFPIKNSMLATLNFISGNTEVASGNQYSIVDIMNGVLNNNLSLGADRKNISLSEQDVKTSKSQYYPDINANLNGAYIDPKIAEISNGENPEFATSGNLSLNQVIYSEQATANISIQKHVLNAQKEDFNSFQLDALLNASMSYFNALILKTNVNIQSRNLQLTKQNLELANENLKLGASGKSDVLRYKSQLAQNTLSMIEARNSLNQAYFQINELLNNPISNKIEIQDTIINSWTYGDESYDYLMSALDDPVKRAKLIDFFIIEAERNAPELKSINYNTEVVRRIYRLNDKGRFIPTVALQGKYNYLFSKSGTGAESPEGYPIAPDGTYNIGVNVSLPIFQQNIRNIDRQYSKIQEEQLNIQKEYLELTIEKNINDIVLDLNNEIANIEISSVNLDFAKESLELSQNEYRNGAIPVIQLIDAQNNYLQAYSDNATAKYNYLLVSMYLQRAIGYFFAMNTETANREFVQRASKYILEDN